MSLRDSGPCTSNEHVLAALRTHVLERRCRPGARLDPAALARDLSSDRDATLSALILLSIEKLIDYRPGDGFFTRTPCERECRGLYLYNGALLTASLRDAVRRPAIAGLKLNEWVDPLTTADGEGGEAIARFAEGLFIAIGRLSGNPVTLEAILETNARLRAFRRSETAVFDDCFENLSSMRKLLQACWFLELIAAVEKFHRRRATHVQAIIRAANMHRGAGGAATGKAASLLSGYGEIE